MKQVLVIDTELGSTTTTVTLFGQAAQIQRIGCGGDIERAGALIAEHDGKVDVIALVGIPAHLQLGAARHAYPPGEALRASAQQTPVVDGSGIRDGLERWGITLADRAEPGIFSQKHVLMMPGLNHSGLGHALSRRSGAIRYADPAIFFALPEVLGIGSRQTLEQAAGPTLGRLAEAPLRWIAPRPANVGIRHITAPFEWADILAGDIGAIRSCAPERLDHKIIVVEHASDADLADLRKRGASILITLMPSLQGKGELGQWPAAVVEALLAAFRSAPDLPLTEDTYLDLMAELDWTPAIRYLQPNEASINRFAFAIHPLDVRFIHKHPAFRMTRYLPDWLVEGVAAYLPPIYVGKITGGQSPSTGQRIEGHLISLCATPRQMMRHSERFTYDRLLTSAHMAERLGARIMGLGAFTSVVGDAGITVAHEADIAITSGNSLTVAATLEAAKQAVLKMGHADLATGRAMIIGATGSIGSVCARLLAQAIRDVVLVSIEPERLIDLKRTIETETPGARVIIATKADELIGECELIVTATSAFGQRVIDVTRCKPGAVICDVARPPDINPAEAALRPDVLVIESGEVRIPGDIAFGYDIGLPPQTAYACLAETALLAMEGRFEDYTLGRNIEIGRVKEIYRLFKKHGFKLANLRSFGAFLTDADFEQRRAHAERLRADPQLFARTRTEASAKLAHIPVMSKGVKSSRGHLAQRWRWVLAGVGGMGGMAALVMTRRQRRQHA